MAEGGGTSLNKDNELAAEMCITPEVINYIKAKRLDMLGLCRSAIQNPSRKDNRLKFVNARLKIEEDKASHDEIIFRCSPDWFVLTAKHEINKKIPTVRIQDMYVVFGQSLAANTVLLRDIGVVKDDDTICIYMKNQSNIPLDINSRTLSSQISNASLSSMDASLNNSQTEVMSTFNDKPLLLNQTMNRGQKKGWSCPRCTFVNDFERPGCTQCTQERPNNILINGSPTSRIQVQNEIGMAKLPETVRLEKIGWECSICTFVNEPTRPGCLQCSNSRPADYKIPDNYVMSDSEKSRIDQEEEIKQQVEHEKLQSYQQLLNQSERNIVTSNEAEECAICMCENEPEDMVVLKECLHKFCKDCLMGHINATEEGETKCPFVDNDYNCNNIITEREIKALLSAEDFEKYLARGLNLAEASLPNSFHCKTPDCRGWCEYDDLVNTFQCPICNKKNCLTCKAIHEGLNCKQYQEKIELDATKDKNAQKTKKVLNNMLTKGDAMHCPQCQIILMKKDGCDWLRCTMCKLEICWVTKGPRWGPKGSGDKSGGCKCRVDGKKCHPNCVNCH